MEKNLVFISTVSITNTKEFIAKEKFVINIDPEIMVKINYINKTFKSYFLVGDDNIEKPIAETTLCFAKLWENSTDILIIAELGGTVKVVTTIMEIFFLMSEQPNGEEGVLLNNGWSSIFYVPQKVKKISDTRFSYTDIHGQNIVEEVGDSKYLICINNQWCVLRTVHVYWREVGWNIYAYSVNNSDSLYAGRRVFYSNLDSL